MPHQLSRRWITDDCAVSVSDCGEIRADHRQEKLARVTACTPNGTRQAVAPVSEVIPGLSDFHRRNWWLANWAGGGTWNLDLDCGAQRFHGTTSSRRVAQALRRAGLDAKNVKAVVRLAKKHQHSAIAPPLLNAAQPDRPTRRKFARSCLTRNHNRTGEPEAWPSPRTPRWGRPLPAGRRKGSERPK